MRWGLSVRLSVWFGSEVWEADVHLPGLGVLYFQEQWAEPLVEPLLLSLLCRNQWIWGFQVPWKNWRSGVDVEMTAKGSSSVWTCCSWGDDTAPCFLSSYLLITYQPILRIFDNFLVSVSFFCTSSDLAQVYWLRGEELPELAATAGVASASWQAVLSCWDFYMCASSSLPLDTLKSLFWKLSTFLEIECQKILFCILFLQSWLQYF